MSGSIADTGLGSGQMVWRAPRVRFLANGTAIQGVTEVDISANNHYAADRFRAAVAIGADALANAQFWASTANILVDIQFSLDGGLTFVSLIQGLIDSVAMDVVSGMLYLEGRDLTSTLIEARTQDTFANRTSSEIATMLAQRHGLTPVVTATTTPVGRYYQSEHDRITLNQFSQSMTEWDLLVFLAGLEGFDVYVTGTSLHFEPPAAGAALPVVMTPAMLQELRLERSLTLARGIVVTVKSWNSRQQTAFAQTVRASGQSGAVGGPGEQFAPPQQYVFVRPNLTMNDALTLAQKKLAELSVHERVWEAVMPGDLTLDPRSQVSLVGTGTDFDQIYYIDVIERHFSPGRGFVQRVRAKNTSPRTQSTIPSDAVGAVTE